MHVTGDGTAAAVWFDRTGEGDLPEYEKLLAAAAGEFLPQFQQLDEVFDANHPTEAHWHLAFLAVLPEHWGNGIGTALMNHTHRRLDAEGVAAYLEATNAQNVKPLPPPRLHRHENPVRHPGHHVPFYRMWRPANPAFTDEDVVGGPVRRSTYLRPFPPVGAAHCPPWTISN